MEGKTEEAQADLARLALIRKQREEAAKRREEEIKGSYFKRVYERKTYPRCALCAVKLQTRVFKQENQLIYFLL